MKKEEIIKKMEEEFWSRDLQTIMNDLGYTPEVMKEGLENEDRIVELLEEYRRRDLTEDEHCELERLIEIEGYSSCENWAEVYETLTSKDFYAPLTQK